MFDFLRKIPLFADLPDSDLFTLCEKIEEVHLAVGEELFSEGSPGDQAYVIKEGELEIIKASGPREVLLAVRGPGEVIGEIALLESVPRTASVRGRKDSVLLAIQKEQLDHLISTSLTAANAMFHTVLARLQNTQARLHQSEKMAQLGTLTAGVAHELNNPAAAVGRSASQLQEAITRLEQVQLEIKGLNVTSDQQGVLEDLARRAREQAMRPPEMDALARSDRETEMEEWLDDHGVPEAWELAPALVNLDFTASELLTLDGHFSPQEVATVIGWLNATYSVHNLLYEISQGAGRISDIVKALKSYSYLDQAPVQNVNVHEGLDNSLMILRHKIKAGISVRRDYAPNLPFIQAYGSELNQVWTNILDNAADALDSKGEIVIRTRQEENEVVVEIEDNGPGIPQEIQPRIFDPFFTTKPPGKGTGLGLNISFNIVVNKHRGDIRVFSQPGKTQFQVRLPVNFEAK